MKKRHLNFFIAVFIFLIFCSFNAYQKINGDVTIRTVQGRGIGVDRGYTTLALFSTLQPFEEYPLMPFIDVRCHRLNNQHFAGNFGGGVRFYNSQINKVIGFNCYYDFLEEHQGSHQFGSGFECLGDYCDFRLNGYFPLGNKRGRKNTVHTDYPGGFFCNAHENSKVLKGLDCEIASSLSRFCELPFDLYLGAGPYFYRQKGDRNIWGGRVRVGIELFKYVKAELRWTHDAVFHNRMQGVISLSIPFGNSNRCSKTFYQHVVRQEIIVSRPLICKYHTNF